MLLAGRKLILVLTGIGLFLAGGAVLAFGDGPETTTMGFVIAVAGLILIARIWASGGLNEK